MPLAELRPAQWLMLSRQALHTHCFAGTGWTQETKSNINHTNACEFVMTSVHAERILSFQSRTGFQKPRNKAWAH